MIRIMPGLYHLKIPIPNNPLGHTNVYLIQGNGENLLIDVGWDSEKAWEALKGQLAEIGVDLKNISRIIVTHGHFDHYGLAGKLRQFSQAKIILHHLDTHMTSQIEQNIEESHRQLEQWLRINGTPSNELSMAWTPMPRGGGGTGTPMSTFPDITVHGGEIISAGDIKLQVLWTPGHSPGHICLYEPTKKILFSGDHILPVITPNISLHNQNGANPLSDFLNSLNTLKQLEAKLVLPAHERLFTDLQTRIEEIVQHHKHRKGEISETLKSGPKTAYQISTKITWKPELDGTIWEDLSSREKGMAIPETLAHLESMRVDGDVTRFTRNGIVYYQLNGVRN